MNEFEIRKALELIKKPTEPVEIRVISGKNTYSGYFKDIDNLINNISYFSNDNSSNIYFVFNAIKGSCYDREQCEKLLPKAKATTSDNDIEWRDWILIDIDPTRSSGVSASDEEKNGAKNVANAVYKYLDNIGFSKPISCDSGNGWHLLYKVELENNNENKETIKDFLSALDMMFSDEVASIDTSVFNASRITKMYGTTARKGNNSKQRPHRESRVLKAPDEIYPTPLALIKKVAGELPKEEKATYKNDYNSNFNIDEFLERNRIGVQKVVPYGSGRKYILDECVFDSNHKAPDACIFVANNGAIGYKCFHNSCQQYTWKDVREKFEPNSYQKKKNGYYSQRATTPQFTTIKDLVGKAKNPETEGKVFLQMSEIEAVDRSKVVSIPSGFNGLDDKIIGFNKGETTVWSGKNSSGKSSILNQVILNACQQGFNCAIFSGELTKQRMKQWILQQCAGRQNVLPSKFSNLFYTPKAVGDKIDKWLDNKLWLYDNDFGNKFENVLEYLKELCEKERIDVVVLDNLMALDLLTLSGDKYQQQTTMILALTDFAKTYGIHLHIVCHPRKAVGFLRKDDISGTADLTNAVDNVIIVHRVNQDFIGMAKEFYGEQIASKYYGFGNVIEVCKNRDLGVMDEMVGLYYEVESRRFLNEKYENIVYGWDEIIPTSFFQEGMKIVETEEMPFDFDGREFEDGDLPY